MTTEIRTTFHRVCACGCRASLAGLRSDAKYYSEACKKRAQRAPSRDKAGTEHPLANARAEQEASDLNSRLGQIVYQTIIECLGCNGEVHADDLEPYFPAEHRERCRKLIGAQFGSLVSRRYIYEIERRKSEIPSRRGAKSGVFGFTRLGRETLLAGGDAGSALGVGHVDAPRDVSAAPGENPGTNMSPGLIAPGSRLEPQTGRDLQVRGEGCSISGFKSRPRQPMPPEERGNTQPARLFEPPRQRPLNPLVDAEAA